jgi:hypothetical protein
MSRKKAMGENENGLFRKALHDPVSARRQNAEPPFIYRLKDALG